MKKFTAVLVGIGSMSLCATAARADFDAYTGFTTTNTAGAVWSYGTLNTAAAAPALPTFTLFPSPASTPADNSSIASYGNFPGVYHNGTGSTQTTSTTIKVAPNSMLLHPDNNDTNLTDLRFTAPSALTVSNIHAVFSAGDTNGTTSDGRIYVNGLEVAGPVAVTGTYGDGTSFTLNTNTGGAPPLVLAQGDTVDFVLGDGGGNYFNDGTNVIAQIVVPEPASLGLLALGATSLLARRRTR